jgi:hypothetical protein
MQNVNGFDAHNEGTYHHALLTMKSMEIDHAMFVEHKLDTRKPKLRYRLDDITRKVFGMGQYKLNLASAPMAFQSHFKPGGTMSITTGKLVSRIAEQGADDLRTLGLHQTERQR